MSYMTPPRFLRALKKTPIILNHILSTVNHDVAHTITDGPDGWTITQIMCHLRDFEELFVGRVQSALDHESPPVEVFDADAMAIERNYAGQSYRLALTDYAEHRRRMLALLESLTPEQWERTVIHPEAGSIRVVEIAMQAALHDVDHSEQMIRIIESAR